MNTQQELARLRELNAKRTQGDWSDPFFKLNIGTHDNCAFIMAAPDMMRFIEHLAAELARKDKLLEQAREKIVAAHRPIGDMVTSGNDWKELSNGYASAQKLLAEALAALTAATPKDGEKS